MAKFRKKPVVIDAVQWFPPGDPRHDPAMLSHRKGNSVSPGDFRQTGDIYQFSEIKGMGCDDLFFIRTGGPNDNVTIHPGDWIIAGVKGEKYPCKPDIFEATYEPADEANTRTVIHTPSGEAVYENGNLVSDTTRPGDNPLVDGQGRYRDPGMQIPMAIPEETGLFVKPPQDSVADERREMEKPEGPPHEVGK